MTVTDAGGDSCSWYAMNPSRCGAYDTDTFTAATACTECGGGVCVDGSSGVDRTGDSCEWYSANPGSCGSYDDADFIAAEVCCPIYPKKPKCVGLPAANRERELGSDRRDTA